MKFLNLIAILMLGFGLVGCNTTRGIGQDVEAVGESIEDSAVEAQENF